MLYLRDGTTTTSHASNAADNSRSGRGTWCCTRRTAAVRPGTSASDAPSAAKATTGTWAPT
eukprot:scaffold6649_cov124-Isochrysis_galbana.AAC.1